MGGRSRGLAQIQEERQDMFPPDRIAFMSNTADEDRQTFMAYKKRKISLIEACAQIAFHNHLDDVTPEQFLNEYHICGWDATVYPEEE